jgi:hypothetical protein
MRLRKCDPFRSDVTHRSRGREAVCTVQTPVSTCHAPRHATERHVQRKRERISNEFSGTTVDFKD